MKWLLLVLAVGSTLAGCAAHTRESEPVYFMSGDAVYTSDVTRDPLYQEARRRSDDPAAVQSRRDFAQPAFGFWR